MKIRKVAVGNAAEAFIEGNFTNGVNIISSDDNNKGKTIVIQSMMTKFENFVRCSKLNFPYCPSWLPVERQRIIDVSIWVFPTPFLPINTWMLVGGLESGTT